MANTFTVGGYVLPCKGKKLQLYNTNSVDHVINVVVFLYFLL